ncbi:hypothetical protein RLOC_00008872 [Lonchura striata]|uniref:Uncharacterized protein n=1 Tax=Lonchura striata TaxID=40157 RepID=A0A218V3H7_9PASE|nr:hypothetical protein RLOC_00008872 [Lonchura striata domestica]
MQLCAATTVGVSSVGNREVTPGPFSAPVRKASLGRDPQKAFLVTPQQGMRRNKEGACFLDNSPIRVCLLSPLSGYFLLP